MTTNIFLLFVFLMMVDNQCAFFFILMMTIVVRFIPHYISFIIHSNMKHDACMLVDTMMMMLNAAENLLVSFDIVMNQSTNGESNAMLNSMPRPMNE